MDGFINIKKIAGQIHWYVTTILVALFQTQSFAATCTDLFKPSLNKEEISLISLINFYTVDFLKEFKAGDRLVLTLRTPPLYGEMPIELLKVNGFNNIQNTNPAHLKDRQFRILAKADYDVQVMVIFEQVSSLKDFIEILASLRDEYLIPLPSMKIGVELFRNGKLVEPEFSDLKP